MAHGRRPLLPDPTSKTDDVTMTTDDVVPDVTSDAEVALSLQEEFESELARQLQRHELDYMGAKALQQGWGSGFATPAMRPTMQTTPTR